MTQTPRRFHPRRLLEMMPRALRPRPPVTPQRSGPKRINLALQGGGAHGSFTWGVLDHLLDDERIEIEGISGASAGAVNAVVLADGLVRGAAAGRRNNGSQNSGARQVATAHCPKHSAR